MTINICVLPHCRVVQLWIAGYRIVQCKFSMSAGAFTKAPDLALKLYIIVHEQFC